MDAMVLPGGDRGVHPDDVLVILAEDVQPLETDLGARGSFSEAQIS